MPYLFVHFTDGQEMSEQIYFSLSQDGLFFQDINPYQPILTSSIGTGGVRDPFIIKVEGRYYIIATDLKIKSGCGWKWAREKGSRDIIIFESTNLVEWSDPRAVTVGRKESGSVWAPEAIFDKDKGQTLVFWASWINGKHQIDAAYTKDFIHFSDVFTFHAPDHDVIDTTIVNVASNYYRLVKDERKKTVILERSSQLIAGYHPIDVPALDALMGVEGPQLYPLANGQWCIIVDCYMEKGGYIPLVTDDLSSGHFTPLSEDQYNFGINQKRHGSVIQIDEDTYQELIKAFNVSIKL